MVDGEIDPSKKADTLLDHQTQRLEDIANNAVDFLKINLLILGAFAPFAASVLGDDIDPEKIFTSKYILYGTSAWIASTFASTVVYRWSRGRSTSQFDILEQAALQDWKTADLRDEMLDNGKEYAQLISRLMRLMAVSVGLSLIAVLYIALGIADSLVSLPGDFKQKSYILVVLFGVLVAFGMDIRIITENIANKAAFWLRSQLIPPERKARTGNLPDISEDQEMWTYISEIEGISGVRARLLQAIRDKFGLEPWKYSELSEYLNEDMPDIGLTRLMLNRLRSEGYLRRISKAEPSRFLVSTREDEVFFGQDPDKLVGDELRRLISHIEQDATVREVIAEALQIKPDVEPMKEALISGTTSDRMNKLNRAVEAVKGSSKIDYPENRYGKIEWRSSPDYYQMTLEGLKPFLIAQLQLAENAMEQGVYREASVLMSGCVEEFLEGLLLDNAQGALEDNSQTIAELLDRVNDHGLLPEDEISKLQDFYRIRNKTVHDSEYELTESKAEELIDTVQVVIKSSI